MKLGVAGPREISDPSDGRKQLVTDFILKSEVTLLRHGDCTGWDAFMHNVALEAGISIVVHPPTNPKHRAYCTGPRDQVKILPVKPYLERNRDIAQLVEYYLAVPDTPYEVLHSGTWHGIRAAKSFAMSEDNGRLVIFRPPVSV